MFIFYVSTYGGMPVSALMRKTLLGMSKNQTMARVVKRLGPFLGTRRFVPGERIEDAIHRIKELNAQGIMATVDHLGEFVTSHAEAEAATEQALLTLKALHASGTESYLSVKLTQLGLDLDEHFCEQNMRRILDEARKLGRFVRIDIEDYARNEKTLSLFERLIQDYGHETIGLALQSYLYKTEGDLKRLSVFRPNIRFVKGAYQESKDVAFPDKKDVDQNYIRLVEQHLLSGHYAAIATHDLTIIETLKRFIDQHGIPRTQFEFQMLYGIRSQSLLELARQGYRARVYIPYGEDWYGYYMRRLAERPENVMFIVKSWFKR